MGFHFRIIQSGHIFYSLSKDPSEEDGQNEIHQVGVKYLISDEHLNLHELTLVDQSGPFFLYRRDLTAPSSLLPFLYIIRTSGSTGDPKIIRVPEKCILSNIEKLGDLFHITEDDVILNCSPVTFDPFLVDLFLATTSGASIIFLEDFAKEFFKDVRQIFTKESRRGTTIMQITPSVFKSLQKDDQEFILSSNSSLRIICFGGEAFPEDLLNRLDWDDKSKRIYNIYGITEISCWSSIRQFQKDHEMDLGEAIDDEIFEIRNESGARVDKGELWIGSGSRKCLIDQEMHLPKGILFRRTGDLVELRADGIFCKGRCGDVIKRFGLKVNLLDLEKKVVANGFGVKSARCVFDNDSQRIILFITGSPNIIALKEYLLKDSEVIPDDIIPIDDMPLNSHGKVSKQRLLEIYLTKNVCINRDIIIDLFGQYDSNKSFLANGGTSISALQIIQTLEKNDCKYPDLIGLLLNPDKLIKEIVEYINQISKFIPPLPESITQDLIQLNLNWKYDLTKCVDASPTIFLHRSKGYCVAVGSHSHMVVILLLKTGELISKLDLPDRVESKILIEGDHIYVGCYDGFLYKWDFITETLDWKFDSRGMIKSEPIIIKNSVVFGNYSDDHNLFAIDKDSGKLTWSKRVGGKGILTRPAIINNCMVICTLDGTIEVCNPSTGHTIATLKLNNPIFANPFAIKDHIIVAEVTGVVHCFKTLNDKLYSVWEYKSGGNIFQIRAYELTSNRWDLLFGCYDNCLYKLQLDLNNSTLTFKLSWKTQLNSSIYGRPAWDLKTNRIICCTTKGEINILESETGIIIGQRKMNGEVFSSPALQDQSIVFGCRDNFVYCLNSSD